MAVLADEVDPATVDGQIVLVGTSAPGLHDLRAHAARSAIPGVDVHAQVIEQILPGEYLKRPDLADGVELPYMLVLGLI